MQRIGIFGNQGDDGDPYPGSSGRNYLNSNKDEFPNCLDYQGKSTNINLTNIMSTEDGFKININIQ